MGFGLGLGLGSGLEFWAVIGPMGAPSLYIAVEVGGGRTQLGAAPGAGGGPWVQQWECLGPDTFGIGTSLFLLELFQSEEENTNFFYPSSTY